MSCHPPYEKTSQQADTIMFKDYWGKDLENVNIQVYIQLLLDTMAGTPVTQHYLMSYMKEFTRQKSLQQKEPK